MSSVSSVPQYPTVCSICGGKGCAYCKTSGVSSIPSDQLRAYRELLQAVYEHRDEVPDAVRLAAVRCVVDMNPLMPDELSALRVLVGLDAA